MKKLCLLSLQTQFKNLTQSLTFTLAYNLFTVIGKYNLNKKEITDDDLKS